MRLAGVAGQTRQIEGQVHPEQCGHVPQVERHGAGVADHREAPHLRPGGPAADGRGGGNGERAHHDCVTGEQQRRRRHVLDVLGLDADQAQLVGAGPDHRDVDREHGQADSQGGCGGQQSAAVRHAEHAGDQPHHEIHVAQRGPGVVVDADGIDQRDQGVGAGDRSDELAEGGDPHQQRHRGQHHHVGAQEPQQLDADAGDGFVDVDRQQRLEDQQRRGPERQVVEHRPVQPGAALEQPAAPAHSAAVRRGRGRDTGEEEQRHDLENPGQRLEHHRRGEQVAPPEDVVFDDARRHDGVTGDDADQRDDADDVDGAVAVDRRALRDLGSGRKDAGGHVFERKGRPPRYCYSNYADLRRSCHRTAARQTAARTAMTTAKLTPAACRPQRWAANPRLTTGSEMAT